MLKLVFVTIIAANGVFIATAKSQARCRKGEAWEECPESQCSPLTCSEVGFPINCPSITDECNCWGEPRCICSDGKVRDNNGKCINPEDCPECGGDPNAVVALCGSKPCPEGMSCPAVCIPNTCECREGYKPDKHGEKCVPKGCTTVCGPNEVYSTCANGGCGKWNCTQIGEPDLCIDPLECEGGCICKKGYLRAKDGTCVPEKQCYTDVCPKNEIYDLCPASCPARTCGFDDRAALCLRPLPVGDPNCPPPKCRCKDGFYRNPKGHCVNWDDCPKCTGAHEVYDKCPKTCPPQNCESIGKVYDCPRELPCKQRKGQCVCEPGYYRNKKGECISKQDCLKCTGPNEYFSCWVACDNVCSTLSVQNQTNCPIINVACNQMCYCEEGYARDEYNICIPIDKCPQNQCTKANEEYQQCPSCNPGTCDSIGRAYRCPLRPCKLTDKGECRCKSGYYRNKAGDCVTKEQCGKERCNKPNEEYQQCVSDCSPGTCESIGKSYNCPAHSDCSGQCRCELGYFRNKIGECITKNQCLMCNGTHEYFSCGPACDNVCATLDVQNKTNCPIKNKRCNEKCYCEDGYARDGDNVCVPIDQCKERCSKPNEVYHLCPPKCPPRRCDVDDRVIRCAAPPKLGDPECEPGCICADGYVRNDKGFCVTRDECPPTCPPNEVYSECIQGVCRALNCSQRGEPIACPMILEGYCIKGCVCAENYLRSSDGTCVPENQCDVPNLCDMPNEEYHRCPSCSPETCESIGLEYSYSCAPLDPIYCHGACRCKSGYYRNHIGQCITEEECLKCTGPNEYYSCGGACDNVCSNLSVQNQTHCPIINIKCNEMCYCDEGYARNDCNICIPIENCPPETTTTTTEKPTSSPAKCPVDGLQNLLKGSSAFTAKFLYEVVKEKPTSSIITSPFSVFTPIGQLALYSEGNTYNELMKVLNLKNKDEIRCVFPQLISLLSNQKNVILNLAARIFANDDYPLSDNFLEDCENIFKAAAENLNFNDAAGAAERINQWVEDQTNNRIKNIANPNMFSAATRLVLANAIYFLGNWIHQFNPNSTEDRDFFRADNTVIKIPTMYQEKSLRYGKVDNLDCQMLELPYNGSLSFLIMLPNKKDGVLDLLQNLQDTSAFNDAYDSMAYETVRVYLPKINVTTQTDLSDILPKTGIKEIFNPNGAGFSGILKNEESLFVSAAQQKAFVLVNELGTEAAAANLAVGSATGSPSHIQDFTADHPFIFYILLNQYNILFCGAYTGF